MVLSLLVKLMVDVLVSTSYVTTGSIHVLNIFFLKFIKIFWSLRKHPNFSMAAQIIPIFCFTTAVWFSFPSLIVLPRYMYQFTRSATWLTSVNAVFFLVFSMFKVMWFLVPWAYSEALQFLEHIIETKRGELWYDIWFCLFYDITTTFIILSVVISLRSLESLHFLVLIFN